MAPLSELSQCAGGAVPHINTRRKVTQRARDDARHGVRVDVERGCRKRHLLDVRCRQKQISTRRVFFADCIHADAAWVTQQARNLSWHLGDLRQPPKILIRDRDSKFTAMFDEVLRSEGVVAVKTPPRAPRANAYAERWVQSARRECLDRMLIFGERHLRLVMREYVDHYNRGRPHRGLGLDIPDPARSCPAEGTVVCHARLGGVINEYARLAA